MPEIRNMDGQELIATKSVYTLAPSTRDEILLSLSNTKIFESLEESAPSGDQFLWAAAPDKSSPLDSVIKGYLKVGPDKLITECNGSERDQQLRKILQDQLGSLLTHQQTISEPIDISSTTGRDRNEIAAPLDLEDLPPEIRVQLVERLENMYLQWADQSVPVLEHQSPRQAVKSEEGRAQVIDLINDWENQLAHMKGQQFRFDFNRLRDELGLPRE
jgi:hypothetical protein